MNTDRADDGAALVCDLLEGADAVVLGDFLSVTTAPVQAKDSGDALLDALVSEVRHRSARQPAAVIGVLPKTVMQRRRRAQVAAGLDDEPFERLLLATAALTSVETSAE